MRVLLISDTHLEHLPETLKTLFSGYDMICHAGDLVSLDVYRELEELGELYAVAGNSDMPDVAKVLPDRLRLEVEGMRIGLIHKPAHSPDSPGVSMMAREMDVDMLVFGHFHKPIFERDGERVLVCPGSPTKPRLSPPSVGELLIEGDRVSLRIIPVGRPVCGYLQFVETLSRDVSHESSDP